jgi:aminodeoxyfutalosine synthase
LSAPEVHDLASRSGLSIKETLERLKKSGLGGMPGGGAEILAAEVRKQICPQKISGEEWLKVHETAHGLGIPTNATMLYGHVENYADRVDHMMRIRTLQDETHGFRSFVPFPYCRPGLNAQDRAGNGATSVTMSSGFTDLKVLSIARLLLDNIPHLKVHWPATDFKFALAALSFGADDIGGTNLHERVMREAGSLAPAGLSSGDLVRCIREADYEPFLADSSFELR